MIINNNKLLYTVYFIVVSVIFAYFLFPSDIVQQYLTQGLKTVDRNLEVQADKASLAFPSGLKLTGVTIRYPSLPEAVKAESLKVSAGIFSLIRMKPVVNVDTRIFGGRVSGRVAVSDNQEIQSGRCDVEDLDIAKISALLSNLTQGFTLSGRVSGKGDYNTDNNGEGQATIGVNNLMVRLDKPFFNVLEGATFQEINAELLYKGTRLQIKNCDVKGVEADGNITGSITIRYPIEQSILSLSGVIVPKRAFLQEIEKRIPVSIETLIGKKRYSKGNIPFRLTGVISDPRFSMK